MNYRGLTTTLSPIKQKLKIKGGIILEKYLVVYADGDFTVTSMNATFEEATNYYKGNYFTFGTCEENEYKNHCLAVFEYDEWKHEVVNFCFENGNVALKFDDEMNVLYFKDAKRGYNHMCTYEDVVKNMEAPKGYTFGDSYSTGWSMPIFETKDKAIQAAKEYFKSTDARHVQVGWCILVNNQLNVINCEKLEF